MTRTKLEKYLGKRVEVTLLNGDIIKGILHKTGEESFKNNPNLYIPHNYYFCTARGSQKPITYLFKVSHIRELR